MLPGSSCKYQMQLSFPILNQLAIACNVFFITLYARCASTLSQLTYHDAPRLLTFESKPVIKSSCLVKGLYAKIIATPGKESKANIQQANTVTEDEDRSVGYISARVVRINNNLLGVVGWQLIGQSTTNQRQQNFGIAKTKSIQELYQTFFTDI